MAFTNYQTVSLRDSAATSGASEQDSAVTIGQLVQSCFLRVEKTAEANADNLLTVRLQCRINSTDWVDLPYDWVQLTGALATAADTAANVTRAPNIVDASSDPTFVYVAFFDQLPTNILRIASVSSGTGAANTFEVDLMYRQTGQL